MSWLLDNIDFENYGVHIQKSTGVLDLPEMVEQSTDWLDLNGKDYWQDVSDVKYKDRDIILYCWINAGDYTDFKTKISAFFTALLAENKRQLTTPYGNVIEVSLQKEVPVSRKTSYVQSVQIGVFNLRLTVSGDSKTKPITIYDAVGGVRGIYNYGSDARHEKQLMGDNTISFKLEFDTKDVLGREDYIIFEGEKYIAFEYPQIDKNSSNKFDYICTYKHQFFALQDVKFFVNDSQETFLWGTMSDIVDAIITNAERRFPGVFVKGTVDATIYKNHQFQNEDCLSVLKKITESYELEFSYSMANGVITINVVDKVGVDSGLTFKYGKGNGLYSLQRKSTNRDKIATNLYAYGAKRNIPASYGYERLQPTNQPLINPFYNTIRERTMVWDDIFPERTGTATSYTYTPSDDPENYPEKSVYALVDSSMPFDLKETDAQGQTIYWIAGTSPKIHFNTGDLAGFEFEVNDYDHDTFTFYLIPTKKADGLMYPDDTLYPKPGDEYKLLDINLPQSYIDDAVARLDARQLEYSNYYFEPHSENTLSLEPGFAGTLNVGDTAVIDDPDFATETLRATGVSRDLYLNTYSIDLSDIVRLSNRQLLQKKVDNTWSIVNQIKLLDPNQQRRNEQSIQEINNKLINPLDEKLRADKIVRSESLDPRMLSYDAGTPQFSIKNGLVETNVDGDYDKVVMNSGELVMHNYRLATKDRKDIAKLYEQGLGYDPTRTWTIPKTTINLASAAGHWLYAKLDMTANSTDCVIEAYPDHKEVKLDYDSFADTGYLMYKLGFISDKASPRYACMLWGNAKVLQENETVKTINQVAHGFVPGNAVKFDGATWSKSKADSPTNANTFGFVYDVIDSDNFKIKSEGYLPGSWTQGEEYFLSPDIDGLAITLSDPEVWRIGQERQSLGWGTPWGLKIEIDVGDEITEQWTDNEFEVYIDFQDTTEFIYNCPYAVKFTSMISESTDPALSVALNTNMAQFDKLTITPSAVGLVILIGTLL